MSTSELGVPGFPAAPGLVELPDRPKGGVRETDSFEAMAQAAAAAMASAPDPALLARMANELFAALPGSAPVSAGVPSLSGLPPTPAPPVPSAAATGVSAPPVPVLPPSAPPVAPPRSPAGMPTDADLRTIPSLLGGVMSFVPSVQGPVPATLPGSGFYFLDETAQVPSTPGAPGAPAWGPHFELGQRPPDIGLGVSAFDPHVVRRDFPILSEEVHGRPLVWLDNAATTQKPRAVIDRVKYFYEHENSNIHRAAHTLAARSTDAYEGAREKVRRFLGASETREIVFVRGATEGINLVAQSWGRQNVGKDDEIVVTCLEHHANIVPWQQLCSEKGARLRVAHVDDSGQVLLDDYERLLGPRTRLVSIAHVSNALGTITPVRKMVEAAHRHGARVLVDGAQAVSHMAVDVRALDSDFYVFSGHKVFAPTGIGVVHGKGDLLDAMPPWQGGGNMIADVTFKRTLYQPAPARFEAGTGSIADAVGLGAALDYIDSVGMENITRYEHALLAYATAGLLRVPGLKLIGTAREKASVLSFVLDGFRTEDVGVALDKDGIAVRAGHHCAQPILRRFGLESTVRPSLAFYNTCEDVDALVEALFRLQAGRGHRGL